MQYGPPTQSSHAEDEYYFQEVRAQQLRARQLFNCYIAGEEPAEEADDDYYCAYYEETA